jgi:hypothetical protein
MDYLLTLKKEIREFFASSLALLAHSSGQQLGELVSTFRILMHDVSVDVHYPLLRGLSDFFKVFTYFGKVSYIILI